MAEHDRRQAEKACRRAEELFLSGNIRGAHRQASKAVRLCPSLPGAANALAAYEVHAAAAADDWRAVLSIRPGAGGATRNAIKKQFRRLSLLVHPDKNHSAAAEGAFKLLRQAFDDALEAVPGDTSPHAAPNEPPAAARNEPPAAAPKEPPVTALEPDEPPWTEPPRPWRRVRIVIYCPFCKNEFGRHIGPLEEKSGMKCARCPAWLKPPWQKKPPGRKEPPAEQGRPVFPCAAQCPACGTQYMSKVSAGRWLLRCKACSKSTMVDVPGPDMATAAA